MFSHVKISSHTALYLDAGVTLRCCAEFYNKWYIKKVQNLFVLFFRKLQTVAQVLDCQKRAGYYNKQAMLKIRSLYSC